MSVRVVAERRWRRAILGRSSATVLSHVLIRVAGRVRLIDVPAVSARLLTLSSRRLLREQQVAVDLLIHRFDDELQGLGEMGRHFGGGGAFAGEAIAVGGGCMSAVLAVALTRRWVAG